MIEKNPLEQIGCGGWVVVEDESLRI